MHKTLILLSLLLLPALVFADTFIVTSNADSGPGTLRDALQKASDNGTVVRDSIIFNLPTSVSDRTIMLYGTLSLSSNLVIDGSTEPAPPFGVTDARVRITSPGSCSAAIYMRKLTDVSIFGLWCSDFNGIGIDCLGGVIALDDCKNFTLGMPHKGNVFSNNFYGISPKGGYVVADSTPSENIVIQSNFFGLDTLGESDGRVNESSSLGVAKNVTIGGENPFEGNFIGYGGLGIGDPYNDPKYNNGYINVINNIVGINYRKTVFSLTSSISIAGNYTNTSDFTVTVKGNYFGNQSDANGLRLLNLSGNITVRDNTFGQPKIDTTGTFTGEGIIIQNCIKKDSISVFNNVMSGMEHAIQSDNNGVTVRDNKIFCTEKGISNNIHITGMPVISIKNITSNNVSGITTPNGRVQIFSTDSCTELCENGEHLLANVTADNLGKFSYTGPAPGLISATVTDSFGTTSEFNGVKANYIDAYVHNATCGRKNGSISNVKIDNASTWYWEDSAGNKIGSDTNLINLAAGKYYLFLSEVNVSCTILAGFTIGAEPIPHIDSAFSITQPSCGQPNGAINYTSPNLPNAFDSWLDSSGNIIKSYTQTVANLAAGKYYFRLTLYDDSTCFSSTPIVLVNQSGPSLKTDHVEITTASCNKPNGSIKNISYTNATGNIYTAWEDSNGNIVGNALNLLNVAQGRYRLKFKDGGGCDTITTAYYIVTDSGVIKYDTSRMLLTQPSCKGSDGSIQGITSTNATIFKWINTLTGDTVGNTEDIANIPAGSYKLYLTNSYSCVLNTDTIKLIEKMLAYDTSKMAIVQASCKGQDGSIQGITSTGATIFKWVNTVTGDTVGNAENITNIPAGNYELYLRNVFGCEVNTGDIKLSEKMLTYDTSKMKIAPSSCKGSGGSIKGITSTGATIYTWINTATTNPAGNNEDLINEPAGTYTLTFSNSNGCTAATNPITIPQAAFLTDTVTSEIVSAPNCGLDNGYIKPLTFSRDTLLYTFEWKDGAGNILSTMLNIYNLPQGHYALYATDTNGCEGIVFNTPITQIGKPAFVYTGLQVDDDTCNAGKGSINNLAVQDNTETYTWAWFTGGQSLGNSASEINGLKAGNYYAVVTDQFSCIVTSDTITVGNIELVPPQPQAAGQYIPRGSSATIAITNAMPGIYNLYDTLNATIPVATSATGILTTPPVYYDKLFYIQYIQGDCESPLQQVMVKVFDSTTISAPNAFSPNGDGINDTWRLQVRGIITEYVLTVFNRYGQPVFTTHDAAKQWDGAVNGKPLPVGTYYYLIQGKDNNGRPVKQSGYVVILR